MTTNKFLEYKLAKSRSETANVRLDLASVEQDKAHINERLAEMASVMDPLSRVRYSEMSERDKCYISAYYVVNGDFPEGI